MYIVNMTPHALVFVQGDEVILTIPPSGEVVRCIEQVQQHGQFRTDEGISVPRVSKSLGELQGLPETAFATIYVVSALAAQAAFKAGRTDVFCPGDPVRDAKGKIVGCRSLCGAPI